MKSIEILDQAIRSQHWHYDANEEQLMDGDRVLTWKEVLKLVPDLTPADIARYQDLEHNRMRAYPTEPNFANPS